MKNIILLAVAFSQFTFSSIGFASGLPLVIKSNSPGHMPIQYQRSESCELYIDQVIVKKRYGMIETTQTFPITLSGDVVKNLELAKAETETRTPNGLCDGPYTSVEGYIPGTTGSFTLYRSGACGSPRIEKNGANSDTFLDIIAAFCPTTH